MDYPVIKSKNTRPYQIYNCCVMDTTDDDITFDENGVCMRCNEFIALIDELSMKLGVKYILNGYNICT